MKKISSDLISDLLSPDEREKSSIIQAGRIEVITWLKLNRKSSGRIRDFLRQKGYSDSSATLITESLAEDGTIDDETLARKMIRQRIGKRAESRSQLKNRLLMSGIPEAVADHVLTELSSDLAAALDLLSAKYPNDVQGDADIAQDDFRRKLTSCQKAGRFLFSRGFDETTIEHALYEFFPDIDDTTMDQA